LEEASSQAAQMYLYRTEKSCTADVVRLADVHVVNVACVAGGVRNATPYQQLTNTLSVILSPYQQQWGNSEYTRAVIYSPCRIYLSAVTRAMYFTTFGIYYIAYISM
jgi:hypothetical protein